MLGLVFSDFLYILFGPKANLHAPQRLRGRSLNSLLTHPAMEGRGSDIENRRYLQRGIIFHRYDDAPCIICQEESETQQKLLLPAAREGMKSISDLIEIAGIGFGVQPTAYSKAFGGYGRANRGKAEGPVRVVSVPTNRQKHEEVGLGHQVQRGFPLLSVRKA